MATASRGQRFFTNHETRITNHGLFSPWVREGWRTGNRRPDHCPRRQAAVFLFAIVHHCSPMFTIVRHCSAKKMFCASVLAPPGRCFPARCGAAWGGYGAAWAAAVTRAGNTACKVFTNHESRDTNHGLYAFLSTISRHFPLLFGPPSPPEPVSARRPPQLPPHSGLVPMRPTPNEPMLKKENVIDCAKRRTFYIARTHRGAGLCRSVVGDRIQPESEARP